MSTFLKTKKEVIETVGENSVLQFSFTHDNIITFKTTLPLTNEIGDYVYYEISLFYKDGYFFECYTTLERLSDFQIYEMKELNTNDNGKVLYRETYADN